MLELTRHHELPLIHASSIRLMSAILEISAYEQGALGA
jgi:hypothetical protein